MMPQGNIQPNTESGTFYKATDLIFSKIQYHGGEKRWEDCPRLKETTDT